MKITYIYHSSFLIELEHSILLFDYAIGRLPKLALEKHIYVFISHIHHDHYRKNIWDLTKIHPAVTFIVHESILTPKNVDSIQVSCNRKYSINDIEVETLTSTDEGCAFLLVVDNKRIFHAGDLNWWHWKDNTIEEDEFQTSLFHHEIKKLKGLHLDVAFLPLDPRLEEYASKGFLDVLKICEISHVFPMHFENNIIEMQEYLRLAKFQQYKDTIITIHKKNESFTID